MRKFILIFVFTLASCTKNSDKIDTIVLINEPDLLAVIGYNAVDNLIPLLEAGADVNTKFFDSGHTPLTLATPFLGSEKMMKILLDYGADVNLKNREGNTPLFYTVMLATSIDKMKILLDYGADVNLKNKEGYTPLFYTAKFADSIDKMKMLLEAGANPNIRLPDGKSLLRYVTDNNRQDVRELLLEYGAKY